MKDWTGNSVSYSSTIGSSNHSDTERQTHDYYATEPKAVRLLLELERFDGHIWECACGEGHLSEEMKKLGYNVYSTDIISRGYQDDVLDFLSMDNCKETSYNIITNPPYRYANDFIEKALSIMENGKKLALFLPIRYLEGKQRKQIFLKNPPIKVLVSSGRLICAANGEFSKVKGSAVGYAWFIWQKGFKGKPTIDWFN